MLFVRSNVKHIVTPLWFLSLTQQAILSIIAYNVNNDELAFVHRVVEIGNDANGLYFVTKGDNFFKEDPDKVRFSQVEGIIVGILY